MHGSAYMYTQVGISLKIHSVSFDHMYCILVGAAIKVGESLYTSQVTHQARAYNPGLCSMK